MSALISASNNDKMIRRHQQVTQWHCVSDNSPRRWNTDESQSQLIATVPHVGPTCSNSQVNTLYASSPQCLGSHRHCDRPVTVLLLLLLALSRIPVDRCFVCPMQRMALDRLFIYYFINLFINLSIYNLSIYYLPVCLSVHITPRPR